ncbi:MAG: WD40/YVTN/BNR-like repeat-containing protein [Solirubrobacteraceae bacterium]
MNRSGRLRAVFAVFVGVLALACAMPVAALANKHDAGDESQELMEGLEWFTNQRAFPSEEPPSAAWPAAVAQARSVAPVDSTSWSELGPYKYFTDDSRYVSQPFSNNGSGSGFNTGRITALAATSDGKVVFAGAAGGGVWKTTDGGSTWTPVFDTQDTLSTGAITIVGSSRGYTVYVGTGESNTNSDSYAGVGVLKSTDGGASWSRVGGSELVGATVFRIVNDGGTLYAATSHGLYRSTGGTWTAILGGTSNTLAVANMVTDVAVKPGTTGATADIVAVRGWREGAATNGLYESKDGGGSFTALSPQGYVPAADQGRTTLAYSKTGDRLYAIVQSPKLLAQGARTILAGVYVSRNGDPSGPWTQIASPAKLASSGSAMKPGDIGNGYQPGVQAWYNQFLAVDPGNSDHLYVGLEEVYETTDGGSSWTAAAPYWNLTLSCFSLNPFPGTCPNTTHSDQHAAAITGSTLFVGNDGGVFSRSLSTHTAGGGWSSLNARLGTLQYYYADSGARPSDGKLTYYGGLQDNGTSKLTPGSSKYTPLEASEPFGGDGGDTLVDPKNSDNVITEYTGLDMATSTDGGRNWIDINPNDPNPRFIAPFTADQKSLSDLWAGGEFVYHSTKGFATRSSDWTKAYDQGAGHTTTALDATGGTVYAAWCGGCNPSFATGNGFKAGIATNEGGTWHQLTPPLATRYISAVTVDPSNPKHAYLTYSGYSRRWIIGPYDAGVGHVFETSDGGTTWTDISGGSAGGLLDAPANDVVIAPGGNLAVATDFGVYTSGPHGGMWKRVGNGLPNVVTDDLALTPDHSAIIAATHGRGLWQSPVSALT